MLLKTSLRMALKKKPGPDRTAEVRKNGAVSCEHAHCFRRTCFRELADLERAAAVSTERFAECIEAQSTVTLRAAVASWPLTSPAGSAPLSLIEIFQDRFINGSTTNCFTPPPIIMLRVSNIWVNFSVPAFHDRSHLLSDGAHVLSRSPAVNV